MKHYIKADRSADGFVKNFAYSMVGAVFFMVFGPATLALIHYVRGTLTIEMMKLPIESLYVV